MSRPFSPGETYKNADTGRHILVLAVSEETHEYVYLAILEVDPVTFETKDPGELMVPKQDLSSWGNVDV